MALRERPGATSGACHTPFVRCSMKSRLGSDPMATQVPTAGHEIASCDLRIASRWKRQGLGLPVSTFQHLGQRLKTLERRSKCPDAHADAEGRRGTGHTTRRDASPGTLAVSPGPGFHRLAVASLSFGRS
jgi:hypothetical protein